MHASARETETLPRRHVHTALRVPRIPQVARTFTSRRFQGITFLTRIAVRFRATASDIRASGSACALLYSSPFEGQLAVDVRVDITHLRRITMADKDLTTDGVENSIKGKGNDLKGKAKDAIGGATGDSRLQAEGKFDQAKGKVQDGIGKAERKLDREI